MGLWVSLPVWMALLWFSVCRVSSWCCGSWWEAAKTGTVSGGESWSELSPHSSFCLPRSLRAGCFSLYVCVCVCDDCSNVGDRVKHCKRRAGCYGSSSTCCFSDSSPSRAWNQHLWNPCSNAEQPFKWLLGDHLAVTLKDILIIFFNCIFFTLNWIISHISY